MRKPIQVDEQVKIEVENLKQKWSCRSESDVIDRLILYQHRSARHIEIEDASLLEKLKKLQTDLNLSGIAAVIEVLYHHWSESNQISKSTLDLVIENRKGGYRW